MTYLKAATFIYIERNLFDCDFGVTGKLGTFNGSRSLHCSFYHNFGGFQCSAVPVSFLWSSEVLTHDSYLWSVSNQIQLELIYCGNNTVTIKPKYLKPSPNLLPVTVLKSFRFTFINHCIYTSLDSFGEKIYVYTRIILWLYNVNCQSYSFYRKNTIISFILNRIINIIYCVLNVLVHIFRKIIM